MSEAVRKEMIVSHIVQLFNSFGDIHPPIDSAKLLSTYQKNGLSGLIRHIQSTLLLNIKIRIGLVNKDSSPLKNRVAWINMPVPMPLYGTRDLSETVVTLYIKKSFLKSAMFESIVASVAHELSHVLLHIINHPLKESEEATDLTAMLLGYREFIFLGYHVKNHAYGYLNLDEINFAIKILKGTITPI